ncbi:glucoside xylosyltransferase 1-like isoform X2 [Brachionus plicatilis]|uniref:UDP-D-xylose:beta-D-glucoside alpha-1,3-D-xylosyltransferase n=1 Tax=Brachionus plicatilis TaxID=10195 RepID=A0A3M7S9D3_BRAPC|nr:glucoside xylosyltransferase 1-like isoform X2 [Brachionus plicatilis]
MNLIPILFSIFLIKEYKAEDQIINLSVVACGDRAPETLVLLKSALMFSRPKLHFFIFSEKNLHNQFIDQFNEWPKFVQDKFNYSIFEPKFPQNNREEWRKLFKLCASQRIFLPDILHQVDSLLYIDTDVLFLTGLEQVWSHFKNFNQTQLAALAPEHEDANMGWYNRFARHPFYGRLGLNSGVMLMNLTRMREFDFVGKILPMYQTYRYNITWGDQCLLNILFKFHPDRLYEYDCSWNYRPDHCMYGSNCRAAEKNGARILHGCRRVFQTEKEPAFRQIYKAFEKYNFTEESIKNLYIEIRDAFEKESVKATYCGKAKDIFLKTLKKELKQHKKLLEEKYLNVGQTNEEL